MYCAPAAVRRPTFCTCAATALVSVVVAGAPALVMANRSLAPPQTVYSAFGLATPPVVAR